MDPFVSFPLDLCRQTAAQREDVVLTPLVVCKLKMRDNLSRLFLWKSRGARLQIVELQPEMSSWRQCLKVSRCLKQQHIRPALPLQVVFQIN